MTNWSPPPPGDTWEQLPDDVLTLIRIQPYTSTACQTAQAVTDATPTRSDLADYLGMWRDGLHARCRLNNKFTGVACDCGCHGVPDPA